VTAHTLVTIATYNEIENLPRLVDEIFRHAPEVDLLVVDDNSPDGTGRWCDERLATDARLRCLHRPGKLGIGSATIAAIEYAIEYDYQLMMNLDADFSHPPELIPDFLARMNRDGNREGEGDTEGDTNDNDAVDVLIGSRYVPGGRIEGWPLRRRLMSRGVNLFARAMLGLPVKDCSGAMRCHRTDVLRRLDLTAIRSQGYAFEEEILWHLHRAGARLAETPITFVDRQHGSSKINLREALVAVGTLLRLGVKHWVGV